MKKDLLTSYDHREMLCIPQPALYVCELVIALNAWLTVHWGITSYLYVSGGIAEWSDLCTLKVYIL